MSPSRKAYWRCCPPWRSSIPTAGGACRKPQAELPRILSSFPRLRSAPHQSSELHSLQLPGRHRGCVATSFRVTRSPKPRKVIHGLSLMLEEVTGCGQFRPQFRKLDKAQAQNAHFSPTQSVSHLCSWGKEPHQGPRSWLWHLTPQLRNPVPGSGGNKLWH